MLINTAISVSIESIRDRGVAQADFQGLTGRAAWWNLKDRAAQPLKVISDYPIKEDLEIAVDRANPSDVKTLDDLHEWLKVLEGRATAAELSEALKQTKERTQALIGKAVVEGKDGEQARLKDVWQELDKIHVVDPKTLAPGTPVDIPDPVGVGAIIDDLDKKLDGIETSLNAYSRNEDTKHTLTHLGEAAAITLGSVGLGYGIYKGVRTVIAGAAAGPVGAGLSLALP